MKKLFVIGGMGAGKTTVLQALEDQGLASIDLDAIGHEVLRWPRVRDDLVRAFGSEILGDDGQIDRRALAAKAFQNPTATRKLNHLTLPRIEDAYRDRIDTFEAAGVPAVAVEYSAFKNREGSLANDADEIIAVLAPVEQRVARAVAKGFDEADVRRRIASQITDEDRSRAADVVFVNDGAPRELYDAVTQWWKEHA